MHNLQLHVKFSSRTYIHRAYKPSPNWWIKLCEITVHHSWRIIILYIFPYEKCGCATTEHCFEHWGSLGRRPMVLQANRLILVKKTLNNSKQSLHSARVLCSAKGHLTFFSVPPASAKMSLSAQTAAGNLPWLSWWPRGGDWLPRESSPFHTGHKYPCPSTLTSTGREGALARRECLRNRKKKGKKKRKKSRRNNAPRYC